MRITLDQMAVNTRTFLGTALDETIIASLVDFQTEPPAPDAPAAVPISVKIYGGNGKDTFVLPADGAGDAVKERARTAFCAGD